MAHWKEARLPVIVTRLFNMVGQRQTGQYGMVIPNFVQAALAGEPIHVHGDGQQTRCFAHVLDVVEAICALMSCQAALGQVINVGSSEEVSMLTLAQRVQQLTASASPIRMVPYEEVYGAGFEDMLRGTPSIQKIGNLIGWTPRRNLYVILTDVIHSLRRNSGEPG